MTDPRAPFPPTKSPFILDEIANLLERYDALTKVVEARAAEEKRAGLEPLWA